tara:strand:- start:179748 stop:181559 length:1812 start_codon:yes stop_codon:yes gene_type:complete
MKYKAASPWGFRIEFGNQREHENSLAHSTGHRITGEFKTGSLSMFWHNMHPAPRIKSFETFDVILFGHPAIDTRLSDLNIFALFEQTTDFKKISAQLNGSFLIMKHDRIENVLSIATDRFSSLPAYVGKTQKKWIVASSLAEIQMLTDSQTVDESGLLQFLFLRRLLGEQTTLKNVDYLRSAHVLQLHSDGERKSSSYWQPNYGKKNLSDTEVVEKLTTYLPEALRLYQSDEQKFGLLMSGGLDSRAILLSRKKDFHCLTTCLRENNESDVARAVSEHEGQPWSFVKRPVDLLNNHFETALSLTSAQQVYNECQFLGYEEALKDKATSVFIGLGFDIFFGGLYLPQENVRIFGRQAIHNKLSPLLNDLPQMYLDNVSYRLKQSDVYSIIRPSHKRFVRAKLKEDVGEIMDRGKTLGGEGYSVWEYMHLHNLSRHYSFPMMHSVRTYLDCRAPALENSLFDLALRMTAEQKLNGTLYQKALSKINRSAMNIRNANTNYPARYSLKQQTALKTIQFTSHRVLGTARRRSPGRQDRSWPSVRQHLESCPRIMDRVRALGSSEALSSLDWLDMDALSRTLAQHQAGTHDHAVLINVLLSIEDLISRT